MTTRDISNSADTLDLRDVTERFEELESEITDAYDEYKEAKEAIEETPLLNREAWLEIEHNENSPIADDHAEFKQLESLLEDLKGYGGDHQWRGSWYPLVLIRDTYFQEYAEELAEDVGAINRGATWPNNCIDWERAANELKVDYSTVEFDGVTYWYR